MADATIAHAHALLEDAPPDFAKRRGRPKGSKDKASRARYGTGPKPNPRIHNVCVQCGSQLAGRKLKFCAACRPSMAEPASIAALCAQCGIQFLSRNPKAKFCSKVCVGAFNSARLKGVFRVERTKAVCECCGSEFVRGPLGGFQRKHGIPQRFCSKSCSTKHSRRQQWEALAPSREAKREAKREVMRMARERREADRAARRVACLTCGSMFQSAAGNYCSARCRPSVIIITAAREARIDHLGLRLGLNCGWCGNHFVPVRFNGRKPVCCSPECGKRRESSFSNGRARAKAFGVPYQSIDSVAVFDRDQWKCHICKGDAPRSLMSTNDPFAPSLDHIIPLSKGGPHMYGNVACAHRRCNSIKSDRIELAA